MNSIPFFNFSISTPNRRQTSCFSCHYINTNTEISRQACNTRSHKFHYLVFYITVIKNSLNNCQSNILWTNTWNWSTSQINCNNARVSNIVSFIQKLFSKFTTAFTNSHSTKSTIASVAV